MKPNREEIEIGRGILVQLVKQAREISDKIVLNNGDETFEKVEHKACCNGLNNGYGSHSFYRYFYGEFEFCILQRTKELYPSIEVYLRPKDKLKSKMSIVVTKERWENTDLVTELSNAYRVMTMNIEAFVNSDDCESFISEIDDEVHKQWAISHIMIIRSRNFYNSSDIKANLSKQESLKKQIGDLEDEYERLEKVSLDESVKFRDKLSKL